MIPLAAAPSKPAPAAMLLLLWKARQSVPPVVSQAPLVAVHVNNGMELEGNAVIPDAATQPDAQVTVKL